VGVDDVLAEDSGDEVAADADEVVLRVEVVEGAVLGAIEFGEDELADVLGVGLPAGFVITCLPRALAMAARAMRAP
jgi:hypothetical protein